MPNKKLKPSDEALKEILLSLKIKGSEQILTKNAFGRILYQDIKAKLNYPSSNLSSMDGYAIKLNEKGDLFNSYKLIGVSSAGKPFIKSIKENETVRIFTGAVVPKNSNKIILQENSIIQDNQIIFNDKIPLKDFIRIKGMDFKKNEIIIKKGTTLDSRKLALLSLSGNKFVKVFKKPRIAVISSGDELVSINQFPTIGKIINSNSLFLINIIRSSGGIPVNLGIIPDKPKALIKKLEKSSNIDLIISTGGASVGDKDYLISDLMNYDPKSIKFWKIAMRPGKPLFFAKWKNIPFLGLPGNPVSVGVCSLIFVLPSISKLLGTNFEQKYIKAILKLTIQKNDERKDFIRSRLNTNTKGENVVFPSKHQDSSMLNTFSNSNCLIVREPFEEKKNNGDLVNVLLFPQFF